MRKSANRTLLAYALIPLLSFVFLACNGSDEGQDAEPFKIGVMES